MAQNRLSFGFAASPRVVNHFNRYVGTSGRLRARRDGRASRVLYRHRVYAEAAFTLPAL